MMQQLFWLIAALGGGFFGAAIGGNFSFVITGFTVLMAVGGTAISGTGETANHVGGTLFGYLAFGPFTGPHVAFAGAAAAAAYAASRGYSDSGKDIVQPLARLGKPDVLMVGAAWGAVGYIIQQLLAHIPWFGGHADTVAWTVLFCGILTRIIHGKNATNPEHGSSLLNPERYNPSGSKIAPYEGNAWLRHMEKPAQLAPLGFFAGLLAAAASLYVAFTVPGIAGNSHTFIFGISAVSIFFLNIGYNIPVTHHITIIGGLSAITFYPVLLGHPTYGAEANWGKIFGVGDAPILGDLVASAGVLHWGAAIGAMIIGALFAVMSAFIGELGARLLYARGTTHIDPPAFAIAISTTVVWIVVMVVQMVGNIPA